MDPCALSHIVSLCPHLRRTSYTDHQIISNSKLSEHFLALGRDLDVMEAKAPEDVYKTHLVGVKVV